MPMRSWMLAASLVLAAAPMSAQGQTAAVDQPVLHDIAGAVQAAQLHATIERLVRFGTRHTLSDTRSNSRGIGAARRWVASEFQRIGAGCGGCIEIATPSETVTGDRVPAPTEVVDV